MKTRGALIFNVTIFLLIVFILQSCNSTPETSNRQEHPNISRLKEQSSEFIPEIIQLSENVYTAVGYDGSNTSMIIGKHGVVIIDALRAFGSAEKVKTQFSTFVMLIMTDYSLNRCKICLNIFNLSLH